MNMFVCGLVKVSRSNEIAETCAALQGGQYTKQIRHNSGSPQFSVLTLCSYLRISRRQSSLYC